MLAEASPVFKVMFSSRWCHRRGNVLYTVSQVKTIHLDDDVNFDRYVTFKLLMQILYGLKKVESLTGDQATDVYYYSNKYQIKNVSNYIQKFFDERAESGMPKHPLSVTELTQSIGFAQLYNMDGLKNKLDNVKLAFDEDNPIQFWNLATKFEMKKLQQQVLNHLNTKNRRTQKEKEIYLKEFIRNFDLSSIALQNS